MADPGGFHWFLRKPPFVMRKAADYHHIAHARISTRSWVGLRSNDMYAHVYATRVIPTAAN